jgi:hypothetical protein
MGKGNRSRGRRRQGVGGLHTSEDVGEQGHPWTRPSKGGPCRCELPEGPMSNALTLHDMSPGLRKVVGRESPRAPVAEEPDAGNPLVRIWRGAELGNRSAYSTTVFLLRCLRERPAGAPTAWTPQRLCVPLPAPAGQRAGEVRGASPGYPGGESLGTAGRREGRMAHGHAQARRYARGLRGAHVADRTTLAWA